MGKRGRKPPGHDVGQHREGAQASSRETLVTHPRGGFGSQTAGGAWFSLHEITGHGVPVEHDNHDVRDWYGDRASSSGMAAPGQAMPQCGLAPSRMLFSTREDAKVGPGNKYCPGYDKYATLSDDQTPCTIMLRNPSNHCYENALIQGLIWTISICKPEVMRRDPLLKVLAGAASKKFPTTLWRISV